MTNFKNIPKILHLYWDGVTHLSFLQFLTVVTFRKYNPNWKINMYVPTVYYARKSWTSFEQKDEYTGKNYFNRLKDYGVEIIKIDFESIGGLNNISEVQKSDYIRYYMLGHFGGCWADMDIIFIKSIDQLDDKHYLMHGDRDNIDTVVCFTYTYPIGFLMSSANNSFFLDLVDKCKSNYDPNRYQCLGCDMIKAHYQSPNVIKERFPHLNILVLQKTSYLPIEWDHCDELFKINVPDRIKSNTIGIHWYNGSPIAKEFQNNLDKNNYQKTGTIYRYFQQYLNLK